MPAAYGCLGKKARGDHPQGTYSYPSAIGMTQYLQGHSRPGIMFAVSQASDTHTTQNALMRKLLS
jgi:hypothetical protein